MSGSPAWRRKKDGPRPPDRFVPTDGIGAGQPAESCLGEVRTEQRSTRSARSSCARPTRSREKRASSDSARSSASCITSRPSPRRCSTDRRRSIPYSATSYSRGWTCWACSSTARPTIRRRRPPTTSASGGQPVTAPRHRSRQRPQPPKHRRSARIRAVAVGGQHSRHHREARGDARDRRRSVPPPLALAWIPRRAPQGAADRARGDTARRRAPTRRRSTGSSIRSSAASRPCSATTAGKSAGAPRCSSRSRATCAWCRSACCSIATRARCAVWRVSSTRKCAWRSKATTSRWIGPCSTRSPSR